MKKTRILSVDGGGIKGIVPAVVLLHLENHLKQLTNNPNSRIHDYFDLFSGASTGAIIIAGLLSPDRIIDQNTLLKKFLTFTLKMATLFLILQYFRK